MDKKSIKAIFIISSIILNQICPIKCNLNLIEEEKMGNSNINETSSNSNLRTNLDIIEKEKLGDLNLNETSSNSNLRTNSGKDENEDVYEKGKDSDEFYDALKYAGYGIAIVGGVVGTAAVLPILLGFGSVGIAAGSAAAGVQASIGSVAAGSWFATMTSLGMTGAFTTAAAAGAGTAVVGAGTLVTAEILKSNQDDKK